MIFAELDIGGLLVPGLLAVAFAAGLALLAVRALLARLGAYRLVWHRNLFDLALYVVLVAAVVELVRSAPL